jgi:hypothetical protein
VVVPRHAANPVFLNTTNTNAVHTHAHYTEKKTVQQSQRNEAQ